MHRMKLSTPHPVAFTTVSSSALQTRLDASTLSASLAVRVIKADGSSVAGGGSGGIGGKGITQPDVTNAQGVCYYTPAATDLNVLGIAVIRISATGMEPREIPVDVVAYDPYDAIRAGLTALRPDAVLVAAAAAGTLTATSFTSTLTLAVGQLANEAHCRFVSGALAGQVQKITGYAAGGLLSFANGFSAAPVAGDQFVIVNG
jgi:hypothetical protein